MYGVMSVGNALYSVSTYGRAHNAAMRLGFNDDINTYLLISSMKNETFDLPKGYFFFTF